MFKIFKNVFNSQKKHVRIKSKYKITNKVAGNKNMR